MIEEVFNALVKKTSEIQPSMVDLLNPGSDISRIEKVESRMGITLPVELKSLYLLHDGQKAGPGFFFDWPFLSIDEMLDEWNAWSQIQENQEIDDVHSISVPRGHIKEIYCSRNWIPFSKDYGGNNYAIDLDPGPNGRAGQVIVFGRDFDTKFVLSLNLTAFVQYYLDSLDAGKYIKEDEQCIIIKRPELLLYNNGLKDEGRSYDDWKLHLADEWREALTPYISRCTSFSELESITSLNLLRTDILDLKPLIEFKGLRELIASATKLRNLEGIENCSELKKAYFGKISPNDISAIKLCSKLQRLSFSNTPLKNIDPILDLNNLKGLSIDGTGLKDLTGIEALKKLTDLDISNNKISDTSQIRKLIKLKSLNISRTGISDLGFLNDLKSLVKIELYSIDVVDYSVLNNLKKLKEISCSFKQFEKIIKVLDFKLRFVMVGGMSDEQRNKWSSYMRDES
ncbi:SMI1/KNR4 family protein [Nitrincola sp. MINF-07-Sa-05]|uniref:SMI1/KNR4 family protein n=2 Tax=Nitrincola salilacus TaxID=3400273 RepID=UPI0039182DBF